MRLASVTSDGDFAYVQVGCGHVTCKREGDRIVLVAGPDCQLAASGGLDVVTVAVSSKKDETICAFVRGWEPSQSIASRDGVQQPSCSPKMRRGGSRPARV